MNKSKKLTAILSGLLIGLSLRSLKERLPDGETLWLIALIVAVLAIAAGCLAWAFNWI